MNASTQSQTGGTRQPKSLNSPKASSDDTANGSPSPCGPHSLRSRKRDRADLAPAPQILPIKRDPDPFARAIEEEEASSGMGVEEAQEISKITELGGLKNPEIVEKMLKLMQLDRKERKIDLTGRVMLVGIIAGTDTANNDCLVKFVQMKGVTILDEWLQDSHKGTKQGEHSNGKAVEELLLALLRALEKLPINLNTLRTCHIGKSVNNLRGHKNLEVQRKARSLVDVWKRRVDEEIKAQELKAGGPTCQTQLPMPKPMVASHQKLQVSVDSQNKTGETEQSPNSSSSFGSIKSGPVMGGTALRHPRRAINGQLHHRTSTGPVTRSSDVPIAMPDHSIGQRIVARMSNASSPVKTHQFQGVKFKIDVKEEKEEAGEKCTETGAGLVDSTGDDLGMLASVATGEIFKAEPLSSVKEENEINSKDEKNKCASGGVHNSVQLHGETKKEDLHSDKDTEGKCVISHKDEVTSVKSEKTEGLTEDELATILTKKRSTDDLPDQATGSTAVPDTGTRVEFDLNEGILPLEDGPHLSASTSCHSLSNPPFAPKVTVAAPAKGSFNPPENLLRPMTRDGETGWRGSGPTSAFRPAEPRRILDISIGIGSNRPLLEIDLNVPDERLLEDVVGTSQKPDEFALDLNITDGGASSFRDFDLNGPGASGPDESSTENYSARNQLSRVGPTTAGTITAGNINMQLLSQSSPGQLWFPAGSPFPGSVQGSYPVAAQRMVGPFGTGEVYRGLAVGSPGTHGVPYLGHHGQVQFPFGFSTGTASSYQSILGQGQRPFIIAPEGSSSSMSAGSGKWGPVGRPVVTSMGLDLNMGPVMGANGEVHGMVHVSPVLGGKRTEPEGWWDRPDRDKSSFGSSKKLSWQ